MGAKSDIEWTDSSWTPIRARNKDTGKVGWHCEHATTGCVHCYSEGFNLRLGTGLPFKPGHRDDIELFLDEKLLLEPLKWRRPRMVFVCSMTDLFADFVPDEWIDRIFAVMGLTKRHTYQVLTKRATRQRDILGNPTFPKRVSDAAYDIAGEMAVSAARAGRSKPWEHRPRGDEFNDPDRVWPLPNVWLGVSCERQQEADERIPHVLQTPAAVRFVSAEPLLGPINLTNIAPSADPEIAMWTDALRGLRHRSERSPTWGAKLDWVIVGGESGPDARQINADWPRSIRDQCQAAGVPFFFKQWGAWWPDCQRMNDPSVNPAHAIRVGKKAAGRLLDGREWNEMPTPMTATPPQAEAP